MNAQAAEEHDQSMEEILQSIKRIIADEEDDAPASPKTLGSDVLELTEVVQDDGTVVKTAFAPPEPLSEQRGFESAMMPARPHLKKAWCPTKRRPPVPLLCARS